MMGKQPRLQNSLFYVGINIDNRVRRNHPLRRVDELIDFDFAYAKVKDCYGNSGNISIPPPVILKLMLQQLAIEQSGTATDCFGAMILFSGCPQFSKHQGTCLLRYVPVYGCLNYLQSSYLSYAHYDYIPFDHNYLPSIEKYYSLSLAHLPQFAVKFEIIWEDFFS